MPYFFDTNIIIGYLIYKSDRIGTRAVKRVEDEEKNHTGNKTSEECFGTSVQLGKSQKILQTITDELRTINNNIIEKGTIDFRNTFKPAAYPTVGPIIRQYLNSGKLTDANSREILTQTIQDLKTTYYQQKRKILTPEICTWHPKRGESYITFAQTLKEKISNTNDIEVLLDAHHAGIKIPELIVVTDDRKDIVNNKDHILKTLSNIKDIIPP